LHQKLSRSARVMRKSDLISVSLARYQPE